MSGYHKLVSTFLCLFALNNTTFSNIMMNSNARVVMNSILKGIEYHPQFDQIQFKTIDEMSRVALSLFTEKVLFLSNKSLSKITN